ncbi:cAMP receptor protein [Symmachiella macrocystis]|uniref:cAMP receptor protein n=1 Tax=Symmachiella macrocystis TaxID=2527985 RepID=A0A5C6BC99_9PLAN|nr:Crp/Fnr family transcriptional regulator [Symmachiella macrocystis]TWU08919.1 cAMP receptor protein [Symmachiella macrocystis]
MDQITRGLRNCETLKALTRAQRLQLAENSRIQVIPHKTLVYRATDQSQHVYLLVSGQVRVAHVNDGGKQSILMLVMPGRLFGEMAICHTGPREESCEVIQDSTVVSIPVTALRGVMQENGNLSIDIITLFGARRRRIEGRLKSVLFQKHRQRLMQLLLELAEDYGTPQGNGIRIAMGLSYQELGSLIGASRETIKSILGELRNERLLSIDRSEIVITHPAFFCAERLSDAGNDFCSPTHRLQQR